MDFSFFENFTTFGVSFVAVCSGITVVIVCWDRVAEHFRKAKRPHDDHVQKVKDHEKKLNNDYALLKEIQTQQQLNTRALLQILNHIIEGNHVENLKESRDFISRYLIEK